MYFLHIMIFNLCSTIAIETFSAFVLKVKSGKDYVNIILVNLLTNPIVNAFPFYMNIKYGIIYRNISLFILEVLVVLVEGFVYSKYLKYRKIKPYLLALILNFCSYFIGIIINMVIY